MKTRLHLVFAALIVILAISGAEAETIWETFATNPFAASSWVHTGTSCEFLYHGNGFMEATIFRAKDINRFTLALENNYDENTEFWWEWDWRSINIYTWPRAHFGVFNAQSDNDRDMIAEWFTYRDTAKQGEASRVVGRADDGTTIYWLYSNMYTRTTNQTVDGRTRLHYYRNQWGEGVVSVVVTNLVTGEEIFSGSNKVLAAGKSLMFNQFGFASMKGDADSPHMRDTVWFDNLYFSTRQDGDSYFQTLGQQRPPPSWDVDTVAPTPNPLTWHIAPHAISPSKVSMTATVAKDGHPHGVQYFFQNITDPTHDSGWQASPLFVDTNLKDSTQYQYRVRARDLSYQRNETEWSEVGSVLTPKETDIQPPVPNPLEWADAPYVVDRNSIQMAAQPVIDAEGNDPVEYYFCSLTDPTYDSGWQQEASYYITSLAYDTEYSFRVKARDNSAFRNETQWSQVADVRTHAALPIEAYLRKATPWADERLGLIVPLRVYYRYVDTGPQGAPVIIYVLNHGGKRIGTEPDAVILGDLVDEGYIVITVDYGTAPTAVSPTLEWSIYDLRKMIEGSRRDTLFVGTRLRTKDNEVYVLPAGYRIARDLVFFELDKHGANGTVERVLRLYNESSEFRGSPVPVPEEMTCPNGQPLDWRLKMDIIYPSNPDQPVPLVFWAATSTQRTGSLREQGGLSRPHLVGFTLRGYAFANIDHTYNPMAFCYDHYTGGGGAVLDEWNGLAATTAALRYIRAHSALYSIDDRYIGGIGHSKGALPVARVSNPAHVHQGEWFRFSGYPAGSPQPQPWLGYSSDITVGYQSMGAGTRRHREFVSSENVPTLIAVGELDHYNHFAYWPELVATYEKQDVPHLPYAMMGLGHQLPTGYDLSLGIDRYSTMLDFFDQYLKVAENIPPQALYVLPYAGQKGVKSASAVILVFAPSMDVNSVTNGVQVIRVADGSILAGTWQIAQRGTKFVWTPATAFLSGEEYEIVVGAQVKNERGTTIGLPASYRFFVE